MRVLLVDVDSKIPNLALCKLSTYYKSVNHTVDFIKLNFRGYPSTKKAKGIQVSEYDKVYISNIFTVNRDKFYIEGDSDISIGGVGSINPKNKLHPEIDMVELDYSLYPDNDTSYGFITRGCPRKCSFCFVPKTEGALYSYSSVNEIVRHNKVSFMDNNILAYKRCKEILKELIKRNIRCEFNQGLDLRLIDEENAELLSKLRWMGNYTFAFDDKKYLKVIEKKLQIIKKYIPAAWKLRFFIYHNAEYTTIEDTIFRVNWCRTNQCLPYIMRDENCWESKHSNFLIDFTSYCNQPGIFKKLDFYTFLQKRVINGDRKKQSRITYKKAKKMKENI